MKVEELVRLSDLLAKTEDIKRASKLPHGVNESDSHHAFSLELIAYNICMTHALRLDREKVLTFALVHDLLEIITGDEATLLMSEEELQAKHQREKEAYTDLQDILEDYPSLLKALDDYEMLDTPEAATVFVLDKTCTIWTHFHDQGENLYNAGIHEKTHIDRWYATQKKKMAIRLKAHPPQVVYDIFESSFLEMRETLVRDSKYSLPE